MPAYHFRIPPVNGKQGPPVVTNDKQKNFDQIPADNLVKQSEGSHYRKKFFFFFEGGAS